MSSEAEVPVKVLTQEEFQRLLDALDVSEIWAVRNYWLLVLFWHTGLRVAEMCGLNCDDVADHNGQPRARFGVRPEIAKGHRTDGWVALNATARQAVSEILAFNRRYGFSVAPGAPLLTSRKHTRMSVRSVQVLIQQLRERADLGVPCTAHVLRHSMLTRLAHRCGNLSLVQQAARHRRLNTLVVHPSVHEVAAAVELLA
ncbi:MAG: tyrosine-type recombinase/integrase [Candidatus Xenobia bacterium]